MAKFKLTKKTLEQAVALKREGLNDCDIAAALGVCKQTFSKWINHPETNLQVALSERIKKEEPAYKEALLNTIRALALAKNSNLTAAAWLLERKYPDEYIERFCNRIRIHSALGWLSPAEFEERNSSEGQSVRKNVTTPTCQRKRGRFRFTSLWCASCLRTLMGLAMWTIIRWSKARMAGKYTPRSSTPSCNRDIANSSLCGLSGTLAFGQGGGERHSFLNS